MSKLILIFAKIGFCFTADVEPRLCSDTYYQIDETNCNSLKASDNKKKCFYLNKACTEY